MNHEVPLCTQMISAISRKGKKVEEESINKNNDNSNDRNNSREEGSITLLH